MIRQIATFVNLFSRTTLGKLVCLALFIPAGFAVGSRAARIERAATCPPCYSAQFTDENFDNVTPPALPTGWLATNTLGPLPLWVTSNGGLPSPPADTPPNSAFIDDPAVLSDKRLDSLSITIGGCCCQMTFQHNYDLEASEVDPSVGFDGGVLEISTDGGNTFQDILAAGGSFIMGGYNRTIAADRGSPIAGRQAWSGNSQGFITTVVNVPAFAGVTLRWRMAVTTAGPGKAGALIPCTLPRADLSGVLNRLLARAPHLHPVPCHPHHPAPTLRQRLLQHPARK
jgi:hypothetical protein